MTVILWAVVVHVTSTTAFDALHFCLHQWQRSPVPLLRWFSGLHQVHHDFLDKRMRIHPELTGRNIWAHLVPEYLTTVAGAALFLLIAPWLAVVLILAVHTVMFAVRLYEEGVDNYHMQMDRLDGRRGALWVSPSYHAMHHINPMAFYSSPFSLFDLVLGTAVQLRGKRILITGVTGAFGGAAFKLLHRLGAVPVAWDARRTDLPDWDGVDILLLAHGARGAESQAANCDSFVRLAESFIAAGVGRLVPPEVWAVGSESELWEPGAYGDSKRQLAARARRWRASPDVTYRHIVPAAYRSRMGWFPLSPMIVVAVALFLIRRGFRYVPVTWTGLAYLNWFRFVFVA